jgi:hypothetical protein
MIYQLLRAARAGRITPEAVTPLHLALSGVRLASDPIRQHTLLQDLLYAMKKRSGFDIVASARILGCPGRWRPARDVAQLQDLRVRRQACLASAEGFELLLLRERLGSWAEVRRLLVAARQAGIALRPWGGYIAIHPAHVDAWDASRGEWYRLPRAGAPVWRGVYMHPPCGCNQKGIRSPAEAVAALGREIEHLRRKWTERKA